MIFLVPSLFSPLFFILFLSSTLKETREREREPSSPSPQFILSSLKTFQIFFLLCCLLLNYDPTAVKRIKAQAPLLLLLFPPFCYVSLQVSTTRRRSSSIVLYCIVKSSRGALAALRNKCFKISCWSPRTKLQKTILSKHALSTLESNGATVHLVFSFNAMPS